MIKKTSGIILLVLGLAIILWGLYSSFNIFTARAEVPTLFKFEDKEMVQTSQQAEMDALIQNQIKALLPKDSIPKLLNLLSWSVFAGIMTFGGAQVAGLGIKMTA